MNDIEVYDEWSKIEILCYSKENKEKILPLIKSIVELTNEQLHLKENIKQ